MLAKLALAVLLLGALASAQTSPTGVPLTTQGRHPLADIFNGGFRYVNTSTLVNGVWTNTGAGKVGDIIYTPAYPGSLFGTMTVNYGHVFNSSALCYDIVTDFSAYTGQYRVFPNNGTVQHYPEVNSNPINGHTPAGSVAQRYVYRTDDDNTIGLGQDPSSALLYWTRNYRFPTPPAGECYASVILSMLVQPAQVALPRDQVEAQQPQEASAQIFPGPTNRIYVRNYDVYVFNQGDLALQSVNVAFNLGSGLTITNVVGFTGTFFQQTTYLPNNDGSYTATYGRHDPQATAEPLALPTFTVTVTSSSPISAGDVSAGIAPSTVGCYAGSDSSDY